MITGASSGTRRASALEFAARRSRLVLAARAAGRPLPERLSAQDVVLAGVATHKLSRLIAKDNVTSFLRAPFTRFQRAPAAASSRRRRVAKVSVSPRASC